MFQKGQFAGVIMQPLKNLGRIVRFHRKKSGLTQLQLADLAGVGKTVVFDVENGKESVRMDTLAKILAVLNISMKFTSPLMADFEAQNEKGKE